MILFLGTEHIVLCAVLFALAALLVIVLEIFVPRDTGLQPAVMTFTSFIITTIGSCGVLFAVGLVPGCLAVAAFNQYCYGTPLSSGYGPLATLFEHVIAVEGKADPHSNIEAIQSAVEDFEIPDADFILLDPPRAGARKEVIDAIGQRAREMICYLSCDPVIFSRDASRLIASGWRLATLDLLDLFPNTHHVETLASFERAE